MGAGEGGDTGPGGDSYGGSSAVHRGHKESFYKKKKKKLSELLGFLKFKGK